MEPAKLARMQGIGRLLIGVAMIVAPARATVTWVGSDAERTGTRVLANALGAREIALGIGQVRAAHAGFGTRAWLAGGLIADFVDLVATVRSRDELPLMGVIGVGALAAGSVALGAYLAAELD